MQVASDPAHRDLVQAVPPTRAGAIDAASRWIDRAWPWAARIGTPRVRLALLGLAIVYGVGIAGSVLDNPRWGWDAHAYWAASLQSPYATSAAGASDAYLYSPAFRQLIEPLAALPWHAFIAGWEALLIGALVLVLGPLAIVGMLLYPIAYELWSGNIHVLLGLAILAGFRYPAAWSFVLLTKVTPGIGLVWFAVRREWRQLGIALAATAIVAAVSFALAPGLWFDWIGVLAGNASSGGPEGGTVPLGLRLVLALVVVTAGALTGRRWTVPIAASLALPLFAMANLGILVACVPLAAPGAHEWWRARRSVGVRAA